MTTETKTFEPITIEELIELAISDNQSILDSVITVTMNKSVDLARIGYKLSIVLKTAYDNLSKVNSMFLRKETLNESFVFDNHATLIKARLERLDRTGKYDYLVSHTYDNLSELDLIINYLKKNGINVMSFI